MQGRPFSRSSPSLICDRVAWWLRQGGLIMPEQPGHRFDTFISYSHADRAWVWDELLPRLEGAGLRVCIDDRDFAIGVPILHNIERAVSESRYTLVVMTPTYVASEWTEFETLLIGSTDPSGR